MNFKKGDIIIAIVLIAALGFWFYNGYVSNNTPVNNLVIEVDGEIYQKIPVTELKKPQQVHIDFENNRYIDIEANETGTWVEEVICPDKLCQKTGVISKIGQSIVCLPNRVNIYYEGSDEEPLVDNVAY